MTLRLAVSNLAWGMNVNLRALERIAALGVEGIEVAPTRIADWDALTGVRVRRYRREVEAAGLRVSSLQAIFFGRPEAKLLGDSGAFGAMLDHIKMIAAVGAELGAEVAVFGAPKNRVSAGLARDTALSIAAERFRQLGDALTQGGLCLAIEPVPPAYGSDFLMTAQEVVDAVRLTGHAGVRVHLDTGCEKLGGGPIDKAIEAAIPLLAHFHIAEPQLVGFDEPKADHHLAAEALRRFGYDHWLAIEMKEHEHDPLLQIEIAVRFAQRTYGYVIDRVC